MRDIFQIICLIIVTSFIIVISDRCSSKNDNNQQIRALNDSIQSLVEAYYSAEDVIAYAYMNSDLDCSMRSDNILYYDKLQVIDNKSVLRGYERFIYTSQSVCRSCVINLCNKLKSKDLIDKSAFIFPYSYIDVCKLIINECNIPTSNVIYIDGDIGLPIENECTLFMFTLSEQYKFHNIYVPDKDLENLTDIYLDITDLKSKAIPNIKKLNNN